MNKKTFYVTTPIYYASGNLHIGHLYTTSLAWTLRNYKRMVGYDAKMLTGSDEHGQKIQEKAFLEKLSPQKYVDGVNDKFLKLWNDLEIDFDFYSRTTNESHKQIVKNIFSQILKEGKIKKGNYEGLYSIQDEEFITKSNAVEKDGKFYHPSSNHELKIVQEESYFFKLSEYEDWLKNYLKDNDDFIYPKKVVNELLNNFINEGLEDLSVTRSSFDWGIVVEEDKEHVIYVWIDALSNYITTLGYPDSDNYKKYWENGNEIVHIVGKEITRFHCIYWPILLKALNLRLPTTILSHGWLITPEGKMSKSKGNTVSPYDLLSEYDPEVVKYYFTSQFNFGEDGVFSEGEFKNAYNSQLVNTFGNLVSRTLAMYQKNFEKSLKFKTPSESLDIDMYKKFETYFEKYQTQFDNLQCNKAFEVAIELGRELNGYIDLTTPWLLSDNLERLEEVLLTLFNGIYIVSSMLAPVMPRKIKEVANQFGFDTFAFDDVFKYNKFDDKIPAKVGILFERKK